MGVEGVGQFLGQIRGIGWLPGRIGLKMEVEQILEDRIHIHRGIVFLSLGLFVQVRSLLRLVGCLG